MDLSFISKPASPGLVIICNHLNSEGIGAYSTQTAFIFSACYDSVRDSDAG